MNYSLLLQTLRFSYVSSALVILLLLQLHIAEYRFSFSRCFILVTLGDGRRFEQL
jgi:hypothetical protein